MRPAPSFPLWAAFFFDRHAGCCACGEATRDGFGNTRLCGQCVARFRAAPKLMETCDVMLSAFKCDCFNHETCVHADMGAALAKARGK